MENPEITRRAMIAAAGAAGLGALNAEAQDAPKAGDTTKAATVPEPRSPINMNRDKVIFEVDASKPMAEQKVPGHNRWHPDIPAIVEVKPGDEFYVECQEWTDNQIHNNDSAEDVKNVDLDLIHMLSGPFRIKGAEPGDLLVVDVLEMGPSRSWGYTGIFAKHNGGSFLVDEFPDAHKAIWDFHGAYATSRHIPGVRFAGMMHPGQIGTAPSHDLLARWNKREGDLIATDPHRVPPLAMPPKPLNALLGTSKGAARDRIAREAARTVPPRENGGNMDIKNQTKGSRIFFPVYVDGANLSVGDLHFSQGDGEITFCGAIEMAGWIQLGVDLIKGGMAKYGLTAPFVRQSPIEPHYSDHLLFSGISVNTKTDKQHYLDMNLAYKNACLNAIQYLTKVMNYTPAQAYLLLGAIPMEGRIGGIVDIPNANCTVAIPTGIFDRDILPGPLVGKA